MAVKHEPQSMTTDMPVHQQCVGYYLSMVKLRKLYTLTLITSKPTISDDPSVSIKYGFIHTSRRRKSLSILVFAAQQY